MTWDSNETKTFCLISVSFNQNVYYILCNPVDDYVAIAILSASLSSTYVC